jgi:hypothetical protein
LFQNRILFVSTNFFVAETGAKCSDLENDELYMATVNKVPEAVEKLIERGADPKKKYNSGT